MISVLTWTYNWQKMVDMTVPKWLNQEGVEYEIVVGCPPEIDLPKGVRRIDITTRGKCEAYNILIDAAKGEMLLLTQIDMEVNDPTQLKRMLGEWEEGVMVTEKFFKDGKRDKGMFHQFMLIAKKDIEKVGKCDIAFDSPDMYAYEDSDLIARLLENGIKYKHTETEPDNGVYHIDHPKVILHDPIVAERIKKARELYLKKHLYDLPLLYYKQMVKR